MSSGSRLLPFNVGKYNCFQHVGGNMAEVYLAKDQRTRRTVVIKLLRPEDANQPEVRERFRREAQLACQCSHPNVITTFESDEIDGVPYIAMEYLEGQSIRDLMDAGALGTPTRIVELCVQVARGMAHLHEKGIVHRDVKPNNIVLASDGRVRIFDFGIARPRDSRLTTAGFVLGTPFYMAPEVFKGKEPSASSDIFAFGIMAYEMFTGERPYPGSSWEGLYGAILTTKPDLDAMRTRGAPENFVQVVADCIAPESSKRPSNFLEIVDRLDPERTIQIPQVIEPPPPKAPPRKMIGAVVIGAVLVIAGLIGAFLLFRKPSTVLDTKGGQMKLIPAGVAIMGVDRRSLQVPSFYMDVTEVSNRAYLEFCKGGHGCPPGLEAAPPDDPVTLVTLDDARAFAKWAGKRLPTDAEWEKAARGSDGRVYPWGSDWRPELATINVSGPDSVFAHQSGASPFGMLNMVGNVWEWVDKASALESGEQFPIDPPVSPGEPIYQIRGGSFREQIKPEERDRLTSDYAVAPSRLKANDVGFRCARDVKP